MEAPQGTIDATKAQIILVSEEIDGELYWEFFF